MTIEGANATMRSGEPERILVPSAGPGQSLEYVRADLYEALRRQVADHGSSASEPRPEALVSVDGDPGALILRLLADVKRMGSALREIREYPDDAWSIRRHAHEARKHGRPTIREIAERGLGEAASREPDAVSVT